MNTPILINTASKIHISVVIPVFNSSLSLNELCHRLHNVLSKISSFYEIIFVNDGSSDNSWNIIRELACLDSRVKGINFSRNFGQHYAITAGLDYANGNWIVVMDCDLQYQPEDILKLYQSATSGYDLVMGLRAIRNDFWFKKFISFIFYKIFNFLSESNINHRLANFGIYSSKVINSIKELREQNRSFGLFALWVGFRRLEIEVTHCARSHGKSSYSFTKMMNLALDSILAHSNKALRLTVAFGFFVSSASFSYALWIFIRYFLWSTPIVGWSSIMVSIFFTTGLVIGALGVVGLYIGKIFDEVKNRPLYIIESTTFFKSSHEN